MDFYLIVKWYVDGGQPTSHIYTERTMLDAWQDAYHAHKSKMLPLLEMHVYRVTRPGVAQLLNTLAKPP